MMLNRSYATTNYFVCPSCAQRAGKSVEQLQGLIEAANAFLDEAECEVFLTLEDGVPPYVQKPDFYKAAERLRAALAAGEEGGDAK
jgi:hypothetical protein